NAKGGKEPRRHRAARDLLGFASGLQIEKRRRVGRRGHALEGRGLIAVVRKVRRRDALARTVLPGAKDPYQPTGIAVGQWCEEDAVDDAENRRTGTDAEGENRQSRQSESRSATKRSDRETHILHERFERGNPVGVAHL